MAQYHYHPDGVIFIRPVSGEAYQATPEQFEAEYGQPAPALPDGFNEQLYEPGVRHFYADGSTAVPQPLAWPAGDAIIAAYDILIAAQGER